MGELDSVAIFVWLAAILAIVVIAFVFDFGREEMKHADDRRKRVLANVREMLTDWGFTADELGLRKDARVEIRNEFASGGPVARAWSRKELVFPLADPPNELRKAETRCQRCFYFVYEGHLVNGQARGECRYTNRFVRRFADEWCGRFKPKS